MDNRDLFKECIKNAQNHVVITLNGDTFNLFSNLPTSEKTIDFVLVALETFILKLAEREKYDSVEKYAERMTEEILSKISKKDIDKDLH